MFVVRTIDFAVRRDDPIDDEICEYLRLDSRSWDEVDIELTKLDIELTTL